MLPRRPHSPFVVTFATALGVPACSGGEPTPTPAASSAAPSGVTVLAPSSTSRPIRRGPAILHINSPDGVMPTWDQVSQEWLATNPPQPVLIVGKDGKCFKGYEGGMGGGRPPRLDDCSPESKKSCGTEVQCPPGAKALAAGGSAQITEAEALKAARAALKLKGLPADARLVSSHFYTVSYSFVFEGTPVVGVDAISGTARVSNP